jgi:hypothetical protein
LAWPAHLGLVEPARSLSSHFLLSFSHTHTRTAAHPLDQVIPLSPPGAGRLPATSGHRRRPTRAPFRNLPEYLLLWPDCGAWSSSPRTLGMARLIRSSPAASSATAARRGSATKLLDHADPTAPVGWQCGCNPGDRDLLPRRLHALTSTPVGRRCSSNPGVTVTPTSEVL